MSDEIDARGLNRIRDAIDAAEEIPDPLVALKLEERGADDRHIFVRPGHIHETVAEAERALALSGDIYQRGSLLVRASRLHDPVVSGPVTRSTDSLVVIPIDADFAVLALAEAACWWRHDGRSGDWVAMDPPKSVAAGLLASSGCWKRMPVLRTITEAPVITLDGRIIDQPGLDEETGILLDPGGTEVSAVPERPSKHDALAALGTLRDIIREFPFEDEAAEAVVLAAILTPFVRPCLRSAPMLAFNAHKMGSGKTLLASVVSYIATGRAPAIISQAEDDESEKKRLLAVLLEGSVVTVIDNVERPLKSDAMCSILTEPIFKDRLLGASKTVTVPTATTWIVTGNNLLFAGDLSTRVLVATLDPAEERPEERRFQTDLHQRVPAMRGELVRAALTIMKAYHAAGRPIRSLPVFGRFEEWSRWCREPLVWLGMADPCATRRKVEDRDPVRDNLRALLESWHGLFGTSAQTVGAVVRACEPPFVEDQQRAQPYAQLREVIDAIAEDRGKINSRRLGNFISKHEKRWEDGLRFVRAGESQRSVRWVVERMSELGELYEFSGAPTREVSVTCTYSGVTETHETHLTHTPTGNGHPGQEPRETMPSGCGGRRDALEAHATAYPTRTAGASSASSAPRPKSIPDNDFAAPEPRTVANDADGEVRAPVDSVRANPLNSNGRDDADGADANGAARSEPEKTEATTWRARL